MSCPLRLPTSARPSTAGGTQDLVAATQAAVDEAAGCFALYAESGVPSFGRDSAPFGGLNPFNLSGVAMLNVFPFQARLHHCCVCVFVCCRRMSPELAPRSVDLLASQLNGGATARLLGTSRKLAPSGVGMPLVARRVRTLLARGRLSPRFRPHPRECEEDKARLVCGCCARF